MAKPWTEDARNRQRELAKRTRPIDYKGRKTGRRFDTSGLVSAFLLVKVRSW